jgi:hypothetical protein
VFRKSFVLCGLRISAVVCLFVITMIAAFNLSGCGGSSSPVSVAVTASAATVDATDAVTLTATVTNDRTPGGVTWSVSGGGTLSNTTTTSATYTAPAATSSAQTVTVTATSVADTTKIGTTTITVPASLAVTTTSINLAGMVGTPYSVQLTGTGGISPYIWTVASGSTLPAGLSLLSTAGVISGTPLAAGAGTTNVAFVMKDSGTATPLSVTQTLGVPITAAPAIAFSGTMPATVTYNATYTGSAAASGGVGTLTYSLASGSLPTGLSLNTATGAVTGTPTVVNTFNFTIKAADVFGDSNTQSYSIVVSAAVPTLTFAAIPAETYGNAPFTVSATSVSGGVVTYSVTSGPATIAGNTVTLTGAGTVVLGASQAASGNYAVGTASISFTVNPEVPTLTFTAIPTHTYGDAQFTVSASSVSGGVVTYSVTSGPATIAGSTVTLTGAGTVVLGASQAASGNYAVGTASISFTVNAEVPTLTFTAIPTHTYGDAQFTVSASSASSGAVTYSVTSGPATITGATVTLTGAGTVVLGASQAASGNYAVGTASISFTVNAEVPTLTFTAIPTQTYGAAAFAASAASASSGAMTYSVTSGPATIAGSTVTLTGAGTVVLGASQAANGNYTAATASITFTVNKATATVTLGSLAQTYTGSPLSATATTNPAGLSVNITYNGSSTAPTTAGSYAVVGTVNDPNYAGSSNGTLVIAKATATVTLTTSSLAQTYTGSPLVVTASTNPGGLTVNFTYGGSSTAPTAAGSYAVVGTINDTNYAGTASGTLVISPAAATVTLTASSLAQTYTGSPLSAAATTNPAGIAVSFTYNGLSTAPTAAGTYAVVGTISNPNYTGSASGTLVISPATATVTLGSLAQTYTGSPLSATATTNPPGLTVTFTYDGSSTAPTAVGSYAVVGTISDANYAGSANGTLVINGMAPSLSFVAIPSKVYGTPPAGDIPFTVSTTTASSGAITYSVTSGPATISGNTVTLNGSGTVVLGASQVASGNYATATASTSFVVNPTLSITTTSPLPNGLVGSTYSQTLAATGGSGTYSWSLVSGSTQLTSLGLTFNPGTGGVGATASVTSASAILGGPVSFTVQVADNATPAHTAQVAFTVTISSYSITTTTLSPSFAITGTTYTSAVINVSGGTGPYTWSISQGTLFNTLPIGLGLGNTNAATNTISGTVSSSDPTGAYNFTVMVVDHNGLTTTQQYTINVYNPLTLPTASSLHAAITGADYGVNNVGINASGGSGSYSFAVNSTSIPTNGTPATIASADSLTGWNSGGSTLFLGGTPPTSGTITLNVTVTDTGVTPNQSYGPIAYTIVVAPQQPLALPDPSNHPLPTPVNINQNYNAGLDATGGANGVNYSFTVQIGGVTTTVPTNSNPVMLTNGNGLTAANSGGYTLMISGTPTTAGSITLLVTVNDSANDPAASQSYIINVINPLAGYDVSGTVNYSGSKTGWIYLQLNSNNCNNCGGPGTAIPAKGAFTIHGVPAGTYTVRAYMDIIGYGAENASDPSNLSSNVNVTVSSGAVSGVSVTLGDPSAVTLSSAPSIGGASGFSGGAFVSLNNSLHNNNGVETATSYNVRWSATSGFDTVLGSESFPATGGGKSPWVVSGVTSCASCYFEVQGVAGSSTSNWSSAYPVTIGAPTVGNTVTGTVTLPSGVTPTGPLYVGFYDMNSGNIYATVIASPSSSTANAYTVHVPTGSNYFFLGFLDQNNNGIMGPGAISNTNGSKMAAVVINSSIPSTLTQNLTLPATGTAPLNGVAIVTTQHQQQIDSNGTYDNYQVDLRVDGLYKLPVAVELTAQPTLGAAVIPADYATGAFNGNTDEFDIQPNLNGVTPQVGDSYSMLVTYSDGNSETLTVTIGAVLNAFATNLSPTGTGVSLTPNFSWTDPANPTNYLYQFQLMDNNYSTVWQIPGNHSNSNGFSSSILGLTWNVDPTNSNDLPSVPSLNSLTTYQWSIQATDLYGNSAQMQASFQTAESTLTLPPASSNPLGSALVNTPYTGSLNASGGSGSGYVFTVNSITVPTTNTPVSLGVDGLYATNSGGNTLFITGTPTAIESVTLTVSVTDSQSHTAVPVTYTLPVINGPNHQHDSYLNGTYVCKTDGFNDTDGARWTSLSSFTANGTAATITSGIFDMNGRDQSSGEASGTVTGTYNIGADNNGLVTMNSVPTGGGSGSKSMQFAIALNNLAGPTATEFRMVESDDVGAPPSGTHGVGNCYLATPSAFVAGTLSGHSFALGMQGENGSGTPKAYVGRFTAGTESSTGGTGSTPGGGITSGYLDGMRVDQTADNGGAFTGSYTVPNSNGRFTYTIASNGGGGSAVFAAYIIDANRMFLLETAGDSGVQSGDMRTQQQTSYSEANLSGPFVLYAQSYRYSNGSPLRHDSEVYQGTSIGGFTINQSYMDDNGTYSVGSANGGPITLTFDSTYAGRATFAPGGSDSAYLYFFDNGAAFELDLQGSGYLQTGWIEPQTQTTFTDAALAGNYLFGQLSPMQATQHGNVGELNVSSSGVITGGLTEAGQGDFSYDQSQNMGTLIWDPTAPGTGTFLIGSGSKGISCAVISATKIVCTLNADSSPGVLIFQQ